MGSALKCRVLNPSAQDSCAAASDRARASDTEPGEPDDWHWAEEGEEEEPKEVDKPLPDPAVDVD